jgi:hypothetical protein
LRGAGFDDVQDDVALVGRGRDVEEGHLVGPLLVVAARDLDRVAGIAQIDEIGALDDTAGGHVEAGDDAFGQAHVQSVPFLGSGRAQSPPGPLPPAPTAKSSEPS